MKRAGPLLVGALRRLQPGLGCGPARDGLRHCRRGVYEGRPMRDAPSSPPGPLAVTLELEPRLYFAQQRQRVPFVRRMRVENQSPSAISGLAVEATLAFAAGASWRQQIQLLPEGACHNFDAVELFADPAVIA